jgi:hypothetical protein
MDDSVWRSVVGTDVAKRTSPHRLADGVLWVRAATSAWAQELALLKTTLCARLAQCGFQVRDVRFVVGPIDPPQRVLDTLVRVPRRPRVALPTSLLEALERIDDHDLRMSLSRAASSNYAWKQAIADGAGPISTRRVAPVLRSAAAESARSARSSPPAPEAPAGTRGARRG